MDRVDVAVLGAERMEQIPACLVRYSIANPFMQALLDPRLPLELGRTM